MLLKLLSAAVAVALGSAAASASMLVDVDNTLASLAGTQVTYEANQGGGGMPNTGSKFSSVTLTGSDRTATIADPETRFDYYLQWNNIADDALDASTYKYAEIQYSLSDDFVGDIAKFRLGDTVSVTGSAGANDPFSNPELLNSLGRTAGAHSFIVDLTADVTYDGDWKYLRWNFFNSTAPVGDAGKSLTIDKITYATAIIPEPASCLIAALSGFGLLARRRK